MKQLLLATRNKHKAREFQELLNDLHIEVLTLESFPHIGEVVEDADTLEGNALKKAHEVFRGAGIPTLADDTGLEVYYLNGEPGVYSSRYAGEKATYADNVKKLLRELRGVPARRRAARFRCVLAFIAPGDVEHHAEGICAGVIIEEPRGANGFGYDPIFVPDGFAETFAEMDSATKNRISHRGRAMQAFKEYLRNFRG